MNAGLSNLATLKAYLIASSGQSDITFDAALTAMGLGVAKLLENECNRGFLRTVGAVEIFPADYNAYFLSRYPIESISAVDVKQTEALGWVAQTVSTYIRTIRLASGSVYLNGGDAGMSYEDIRFTFTGGYWWRTTEPNETAYDADTLPSGATALPSDLQHAWLIQCAAVWEARDKLGTGLVEGDNKVSSKTILNQLDLTPAVKRTLANYRRLGVV